MSIESELKRLFESTTRKRAAQLKPEEVDALAVKEAAGALLRLKGQPKAQMALARALQPDTAAALCRWLADPSFWGLVGGITRH